MKVDIRAKQKKLNKIKREYVYLERKVAFLALSRHRTLSKAKHLEIVRKILKCGIQVIQLRTEAEIIITTPSIKYPSGGKIALYAENGSELAINRPGISSGKSFLQNLPMYGKDVIVVGPHQGKSALHNK